MTPKETPPLQAIPDGMRLGATAAYLGVSRSTVYRLMSQGLPARKLGSIWIFRKSELDAWMSRLPGVNLPTAS